MAFGQCCTQSCHRIVDFKLGQSNNIHIALNHNQAGDFFEFLPRLVKPVELAPFMKHWGLWRVKVFGCAVIQHSSTKANRATALVTNGEGDAVAEAIILLFLFGLGDDHAGFIEQVDTFLISTHCFKQIVPPRWRVANTVLTRYLAT